MYEELRKKAKKRVQAKMAFYICAMVFSSVIIVLMALSFYIPPIAFWVRLPIPILIMVLGVVYISAFGLPFQNGDAEDWEEEEIEKEMIKLYRQKKAKLPPTEELSEKEILELKELERLKQNRDGNEDFV